MRCRVDGPGPRDTPAAQPTVVFVHGSLHGAWCWAERWMPYLAARGYRSVAVNLRGTSGALPDAGYNGGRRVVPVQDHVEDIAEVVQRIIAAEGRPVALVGHSFGALLLMKVLERPGIPTLAGAPSAPGIAGLGLLCSVPPTGNGPMVGRFLRSRPVLAFKITWGFVAGGLKRSVALCRELFFGPDMPDALIKGYLERFEADGTYSLDVAALNAQLPIRVAESHRGGQAKWAGGPHGLPTDRILVVGVANDAVLDEEAVIDTGRFCGVTPTVLPDTPHDLMLDAASWERGAAHLAAWLDRLR